MYLILILNLKVINNGKEYFGCFQIILKVVSKLKLLYRFIWTVKENFYLLLFGCLGLKYDVLLIFLPDNIFYTLTIFLLSAEA